MTNRFLRSALLAEAKRVLPGRRYYRVQRVAETCRLDRDLREAGG